MKRVILCIMLCLFAAVSIYCPIQSAAALTGDGEPSESVVIYDEDNNILTEKSAAEVGDRFVLQDFYEYQIFKVVGRRAYAKRLGKIAVPQIKRDDLRKIAPISTKNRKICLYCTHNDESYRLSDGYDSIYGAGGIHDVAMQLKNQLEKLKINVVFDQTLHIPHDSNAYSRSKVTATRLLTSEKPDAIFDIHRDGVSRNYYLLQQNGENLSKIRIVLGKSNENYQKNYQFAQKVFAIGNSMYPGLFLDIYTGKGHYNQSLKETALLFEMGTYLIEKEYVMASVPKLAQVVQTALYDSIQENSGDIVVDENSPETKENPEIDAKNAQNDAKNDDFGKNNAVGIAFAVIIPTLIVGAIVVGYVMYRKRKNERK